jgi:CHASE2 domain-containing sensor protein
LLNKLKADQSGPVIFDVWFPGPEREPADTQLAEAIKLHGQVVLPGVQTSIALPGLVGKHTLQPWTNFLYAAGTNWGISELAPDGDLVVRKHYNGTELGPSLAWAAATLAAAPVTKIPVTRGEDRWIRYYGASGTLPSLSYYLALDKPHGFFTGKIIFIGGKPDTRYPGEAVDDFRTPYTRWTEQKTPGVEINATMFLNLLRGDWFTRLSWGKECLNLVVAGLVLGYGLAQLRPMVAAGLAVLAFFLIALVAIVLVWQTHLWFSWMVIAGVQVPCAFLWSVLTYTKTLTHDKEVLEIRLASSLSASQNQSGRPVTAPDGTRLAPSAPDHKLLRIIGKGGYGEVWLAVNTIGLYHAVKIIDLSHFETAEPYMREFKGMEKYMPISINHPGLVHILHVGRNDEAGYFFYVMEIGDDEVDGNRITPETYSPRNLAKDLAKRGKIPVPECVSMGLALTDALEFLHQQQLIHRDIKPSNIIFVNGIPKLADIGLVTDIGVDSKSVTYVGTKGFIAPEGPGTPAADVYSMGKVLYEAATGLDRLQFPKLPSSLGEAEDTVQLMRLNAIFLKACEKEVANRYQSAAELRANLLDLQRHWQ